MLDGLLIALAVVAVLACPTLMWLGRRGIGPGCAMMGRPKAQDETLDGLRARQRELAERIEKVEAGERSGRPAAG